MLDAALDILFDSLDELKKEQIYLARIAGRDEDKIPPFRRRFARETGKKKGDYDIAVESMSKAKSREEVMRGVRKDRRRDRIFEIQGRIYELQSCIDMIKSLEDVGPDDAVEYEVGTAVDDNGMPIRVDIDKMNPFSYNGEE